MSNIVCYTQDVPGERSWIEENYPTFNCVQTIHSGLWKLGDNLCYEVPCCDKMNVSLEYLKDVAVSQHTKTLFDQQHASFNDSGWVYADSILINNNVKFTNVNKDIDSYQMFTFTRCGSVFTESILQQKYTQLSPHYILENNPERILDLLRNHPKAMIVMIYRKNWWDWIASTAIMESCGPIHYDSDINFNKIVPLTITNEYIDRLEHQITSMFNFWCNLRFLLPIRHFRLYTYESIINKETQSKTLHSKILYDKSSLIVDYKNKKSMFNEEYLPKFQQVEKRAIAHLNAMGIFETTQTI